MFGEPTIGQSRMSIHAAGRTLVETSRSVFALSSQPCFVPVKG